MNNNDKNKNNSIDIPSFINYQDNSKNRTQQPRNQYEYDYDSDAFLKEINSSLAKQISEDFNPKNSIPNNRRRKKKLSKLIKIPLCVFLTLLVLSGLLVFTKGGQRMIIGLVGKYIYHNLEYQPSKDTQQTENPDSSKPIRNVITDGPVINILLVGIEEIQGAQNTDSMIIATMNTDTHTLKLTSLMRDLYVEIPDHNNNKLNSAYAKGGVSLLFETIENNFDVQIDGYCLVNFEAFETIVDMVGGVKITLTAEEAKYLNTTNYISNKKNRHVVEGPQIMNGNQALGYCRVRKVSTGTENNDFGRTQRQRIVLDAIYDRVKSKNIVQLMVLMNDVLKNVEIKTDITQKEFNHYLEVAAGLKVKELQTARIPSNGSFENAKVKIGSRKVDVLKPKDWEVTRKELHDFIYGVTSDAVTTD